MFDTNYNPYLTTLQNQYNAYKGGNAQYARPTVPMNLRQIENWDSPQELYINGVKWTLRKDYRDSSGSIPNITSIQFDDVNSGYMPVEELSTENQPIYLYLYYGTILPKMGSYEKPMSVFFQWFSDKPIQLRKDLISESDWNRANVYVSDYGSIQNATKESLFNAVNAKSNAQPVEVLPNIRLNNNFVKDKKLDGGARNETADNSKLQVARITNGSTNQEIIS